MSHTQVQEPNPTRISRSRLLRWASIGVAAAVAIVAVLYVYLEYYHDRELREAIAESDRLDPGWRFADIEAARAVVPDAENSAPIVLAAAALMPKNWRAGLELAGAPPLEERLAELPPPQFPDEADLFEMRAALAKVAAALDKARGLADRPRGRYVVAWSDDVIGTLVSHVEHPRAVVPMLTLDALVRCHDGDTDGAVRSCRAALNAGRSLGDEPMTTSQLIRAASALDAVRALERALATGTASPRTLEEMQRLLEDEAAQPLLLRALRDARVCYFQPLELMRIGKFNRATYKMATSMLGETGDSWIDRRNARASQAAYLRWSTAMVEIAKMPTETQDERLRALAMPTQQLPALIAGLTRGPDWVKLARKFNQAHAELRCATAGLAAERFRLAERRWPDRLDGLVPRYLAAVPIDPFDGQPLRFRRLEDGLVIYSVGLDRTDDGGKLDRKRPGEPGTDVGFQLWDADRRITPARE
jgi:hypothetical protein